MGSSTFFFKRWLLIIYQNCLLNNHETHNISFVSQFYPHPPPPQKTNSFENFKNLLQSRNIKNLRCWNKKKHKEKKKTKKLRVKGSETLIYVSVANCASICINLSVHQMHKTAAAHDMHRLHIRFYVCWRGAQKSQINPWTKRQIDLELVNHELGRQQQVF